MRLKPSLICLIFTLFLFSATSAWSADLDKGWDAYQKGDYATALREWEPLAEQGDVFAQSGLGLMYENGWSVPQDFQTAVKWYSLAAEQGNPVAQNNLGEMYYDGHGVPQNNLYAHMWWNIAASQGYEGAARHRDLAAERMTPADISAAQKLAHECVKKNYKDC